MASPGLIRRRSLTLCYVAIDARVSFSSEDGPPVKRQNEVSAINALTEILPFLTGVKYREVGSPDERQSRHPDVDWVMTAESGTLPPIAVEHTVVEAFKGQMEYVNRSNDIVDRVNAACSGKLPGDRYFILVISHRLVAELRKTAIDTFVGWACPWVTETTRDLQVEAFGSANYQGHPLLITCPGSEPSRNGTIFRIPGRPDDHEALAVHSLWIALTHGLTKFPKYKGLGYHTVMSLEDISGEIYPDMLHKLIEDPAKDVSIRRHIDYVIAFASAGSEMIVGNVWKELDHIHVPVPATRRFGTTSGKWEPYDQR